MNENRLTIDSASYFFMETKKNTESIIIYRTFDTLPLSPIHSYNPDLTFYVFYKEKMEL
jgi:hypothetical protein